MRTKKQVAAAVAASVTAALFVGSSGPATAASPYCTQTTPNTTLMFYKRESGTAAIGTLAAGHWQQTAILTLPTGYTHAAASRDTLVLYNTNTGAGESGIFKSGNYTRVRVYANFSTGWTAVEATGDSVLFYNASTGRGSTGTLKNGEYQEMRQYADLNTGWANIAGSCDTMAFAGAGFFPFNPLAHGTLTDGVYTYVAGRTGVYLGTLTGTQDSLLSLAGPFLDAPQNEFNVATATDGTVSAFRHVGTSSPWDMVGRSTDSLLFYRNDGTTWTATMTGGNFANVGPVANISAGWSIIEGGV